MSKVSSSAPDSLEVLLRFCQIPCLCEGIDDLVETDGVGLHLGLLHLHQNCFCAHGVASFGTGMDDGAIRDHISRKTCKCHLCQPSFSCPEVPLLRIHVDDCLVTLNG